MNKRDKNNIPGLYEYSVNHGMCDGMVTAVNLEDAKRQVRENCGELVQGEEDLKVRLCEL